VSNALPLANLIAPSSAPMERPLRAPISTTVPCPRGSVAGLSPRSPQPLAAPRVAPPSPPPIPRTMAERMLVARERIRAAAEAGQRVRSYEVALDLDLSEFHFARQFRAAFARSPHVYYDEVRAERARALLGDGMSEGDVARRVGFRRPAELRALLAKRTEPAPC
jgi:AraC family transcriptional regulator